MACSEAQLRGLASVARINVSVMIAIDALQWEITSQTWGAFWEKTLTLYAKMCIRSIFVMTLHFRSHYEGRAET